MKKDTFFNLTSRAIQKAQQRGRELGKSWSLTYRMFENQNKYQDYLSLALLELLNENTFYDIKPETIIKKSQIKVPDDFFWLADNKIKLLKYYFQSSNNKILSEAVLDFNEDDNASVNDKLTDIIIRSFEFHQKFRLSLANIYKLKFLNFKIFELFLFFIEDLSSKSLNISNGLQHNYKDDLVLLGLISTYSLIFDKWISSNDEDFSTIMKVADEYLNNAEEVGLNFRVIWDENKCWRFFQSWY